MESVGRCSYTVPPCCKASGDATLTHMERIGLRQLQQNAAAAVRRVQKGEPLEVTDRGRPVALLVPLNMRGALDALDAAGRLSRADGDLLEIGPPPPLPPGAEAPSRVLARLRDRER